MRAATSYQEWRELAEQLDQVDANRLGGRCGIEEGRLYDRKLLLQKLQHLQQVREGGNIREMMFNLRSDLIRNVANVAKSQLHEHSHSVPSTIRSYITEVQTQVNRAAPQAHSCALQWRGPASEPSPWSHGGGGGGSRGSRPW
ncbi:hypothetical protein MNEG_8084 [Monoraphidium neglectum]|uniref:Triacylglycerol lipase N-terminal domain-containing protein n=1 Tax=Monoraphidium neglectum TaxID=145388 RepID=A0A0D2MGN4_9CHLO|nr:hypothetical protein MNEG_8084 [Monoraphidium neglectum]KIY99881.1 hypothetical protein MNEG_8084 [Monoraphidium neglectum]|eukprot:XP_013898901.1 hypothetical protein MNEG_8084 [Monoraphidium neglectum]